MVLNFVEKPSCYEKTKKYEHFLKEPLYLYLYTFMTYRNEHMLEQWTTSILSYATAADYFKQFMVQGK